MPEPLPELEVLVSQRLAAFRRRYADVLERISKSAPLPSVLEAIVLLIQEQSPGTIASVLLISDDGLRLRHGASPDLPDAISKVADGLPIGPFAGSCGTAAYRRSRVVVADIASDPLWEVAREVALATDLRSCWSEPVFGRDGQLLGTFALYHRSVREPNAEDLETIQVAAHFAGLAIERERRQAKLIEKQKLESLGVLAGGIAHDFNNLLTGILGNAGLARIQVSEDSAAQSTLDEIEKTALRAAELCQQMLAYAGKGNFVTRRLDLSHLVKDATNFLTLSAGTRAKLSFHLAPHLPLVEGDSAQLHQILMNLVVNAAESLPEAGGTIQVSTGIIKATRASLADSQFGNDIPPGEYIFLEVCDSGCGMTPETRARIFDPFFTTKFTGRGLGLASVLGIVRSHRGALKVNSEPGRGSTFRLLLPPVHRQSECANEQQSATPAGARL